MACANASNIMAISSDLVSSFTGAFVSRKRQAAGANLAVLPIPRQLNQSKIDAEVHRHLCADLHVAFMTCVFTPPLCHAQAKRQLFVVIEQIPIMETVSIDQ